VIPLRGGAAPTPLLTATVLLGIACDAHVDEGCVSGPCGPETAPSIDPNASAAGGGGGGGAPDCSMTPDTGEFPCDVYAVLKARCHPCHTDPQQRGAPFSLLTYEDTRVPYGSGPRAARMLTMVQTNQMPPPSEPRPTAEERATLLGWLGSCAKPAPDGEQGCECTDPAACP
jgi:hypothetical protein